MKMSRKLDGEKPIPEPGPITEADLREAESLSDFSRLLSQAAEFQDQPHAGTRLYDSWRFAFIHRRKNERAHIALANIGVSTEELEATNVEAIESRSSNGHVIYESIDELIDDLRAYFIPTLPEYDVDASGTHVQSNVERHDGEEAALIMQGMQRLFGDDKSQTERIIDELTEWAAGQLGDRRNKHTTLEKYFDSFDDGYGDPYKYHSGYLGGHRISAKKLWSGQIALNMRGGGYAYSERGPTKQIDDFAAYVGRKVVYEDAVVKLQAPLKNNDVTLGDIYEAKLKHNDETVPSQEITYTADISGIESALSTLGIDTARFHEGLSDLSQREDRSTFAKFPLEGTTSMQVEPASTWQIARDGTVTLSRTHRMFDTDSQPGVYKPVIIVTCKGDDAEKIMALRHVGSLFRASTWSRSAIRPFVKVDPATSRVVALAEEF